MDNSDVLRELFNARFDALEAKIALMVTALEKENDRQDEAIERIADRSTHISETGRLTERVEKLEKQIDAGRNRLNDLEFKGKIAGAIGAFLIALSLSILAAVAKGWIGV
jgi:hypothetical protein